ncbi:MAG: hypothetical protein EOM20_11760 [Spartobacteria bacterium]|nr:hypothetical protein [Spartobacteria bacterium]
MHCQRGGGLIWSDVAPVQQRHVAECGPEVVGGNESPPAYLCFYVTQELTIDRARRTLWVFD